MRDLNYARVEAFKLSFPDDIAPPRHERIEHAEHADAEDQRRGGIHMMHPAYAADRHDKDGHCTDSRPRARVHQMVVVMLGMRVGHRPRLRSKLAHACSRKPITAFRGHARYSLLEFLSGVSATGRSRSRSR